MENRDEQNLGNDSTSQVPEADAIARENEGESTQDEQQFEETKSEDETMSEVGDNKTFAILGYILPFLFFLPLLNESSKDNQFARFHANQQLILLVLILGIYLLHNLLYMMFFMGGFFLTQLINLALLVFVVLGVINAAQGKMKELPLIGGFRLLK